LKLGTRHSGRELALKALYRTDIWGEATTDGLALFFENFPVDDRSRRFAVRLVDGVLAERPELDKLIADALKHWKINRLSRVDHNILRLGLFELIRMDDIPARVTIDEAIELAKEYGDNESGRFVNGVLDELAGRLNLRTKGDDVAVAKSH
jgi:N utilization substance protein B